MKKFLMVLPLLMMGVQVFAQDAFKITSNSHNVYSRATGEFVLTTKITKNSTIYFNAETVAVVFEDSTHHMDVLDKHTTSDGMTHLALKGKKDKWEIELWVSLEREFVAYWDVRANELYVFEFTKITEGVMPN
jgi:hypothetical protein